MQYLLFLLIANFQLLIFAFQLADVLQQRLVGLFASQELLHHLLNIRITSTGAHQLESLFSMSMLLHLAFHTLLEVARPNLLDVEFLLHLFFLLVLALVLGLLSNQVLI